MPEWVTMSYHRPASRVPSQPVAPARTSSRDAAKALCAALRGQPAVAGVCYSATDARGRVLVIPIQPWASARSFPATFQGFRVVTRPPAVASGGLGSTLVVL